MLYIEQPDTSSRRKQHDREMHHQKRLEADQPHERADDQRDREVGEHGAGPRLPAIAHKANRQAVLQDKKVGRSNSEHDQWVAIEPILQPAPARTRQIFAHGQSIDIANSATVEVASSRMMNGMGATPNIIRCQRERTDNAADPVVRPTVCEESAMATVVLNHKQANEKACGRNCNKWRGPAVTQREWKPGCGATSS